LLGNCCFMISVLLKRVPTVVAYQVVQPILPHKKPRSFRIAYL